MARTEWRPDLFDHVADLAWELWLDENEPKLLAQARAEAPKVTGNLRYNHKVVRLPKRVAHLLGDTFYAHWVHDGRGPVVPKVAKALRWVTKAGVVVYARRSGPSKPNPWLVRACQKLGLRVVR